MKPQPFRLSNPRSVGNRHVRWLQRLSFLGIALLAVNVALADPAWYDGTNQKGVEPGTPDFYQHQPSPLNETEATSGWCFQSSFEDALFYLHNNGYAQAYVDNTNWVAAMLTNLSSVVNGSPGAFVNAMNTYIGSVGLGTALVTTGPLNPGGNTSAIFNTLTQDLLDGSNVLVHLAPNGVGGLWWGGSYHVMDAVGFDKVNKAIVVADPDNNKYGGFGYPGDATPNLLVNYSPTNPPPIETGWGDVGSITNAYLQEYAVDNTGMLTNGPYAGTLIDQLFVIGVVPEPSTLALVLASAAMFGGYRLAGRRKNRSGTS